MSTLLLDHSEMIKVYKAILDASQEIAHVMRYSQGKFVILIWF